MLAKKLKFLSILIRLTVLQVVFRTSTHFHIFPKQQDLHQTHVTKTLQVELHACPPFYCSVLLSCHIWSLQIIFEVEGNMSWMKTSRSKARGMIKDKMRIKSVQVKWTWFLQMKSVSLSVLLLCSNIYRQYFENHSYPKNHFKFSRFTTRYVSTHYLDFMWNINIKYSIFFNFKDQCRLLYYYLLKILRLNIFTFVSLPFNFCSYALFCVCLPHKIFLNCWIRLGAV